MSGIGIDYGAGQTNIDKSNGIRYSVISMNDLDMDGFGPIIDEAEDLDYENAITTIKRKIYTALEHLEVPGFEVTVEAAGEVWDIVADAFNDNYTADKVRWSYISQHNEYRISSCGINEIFITKSPHYTHAQFCSPCAPGACHLENYMAEGPMTYALGHAFFVQGVAPYPVYDVAGSRLLVIPEGMSSDEFNPDCYVIPKELDPWIRAFEFNVYCLPAEHAIRLRDYCEHKKEAMINRLTGEIHLALIHERNCARIYNDIPEEWKW